MESGPNRHGVFEDSAEIVLAHGRGYKAIARIANYEGGWFYGYSAIFRQGGVLCGASIRNSASSKAEAIDKARGILITHTEGLAKSCSVDYSDVDDCLRELLSQHRQSSFDF